MIDICTTIKFAIQDVERFGPSKSKPIAEKHHAHFNITSGEEILLKVYYDVDTYLADKVLRWDSYAEEENLSDVIVFEKINEEYLLEIDIKGSKVVHAQMSLGGMFERGIGSYFTISFDKIKLRYKLKEPRKSNDVFIGLNTPARTIINDIYQFRTFWDNEGSIWEGRSEETNFRVFNDVEYKLKFIFGLERDKEKDLSTISKHPQLLLKFGDLSLERVNEYVSYFCTILSFYINADISTDGYSVYFEDTKVRYFSIPSDTITIKPFFILHDFHASNNLFEYIEACKFITGEDLTFIKKVIHRFNLTSVLQGEARFMILYELFERLKTRHAKGNREIKKEYSLTVSKKEKRGLVNQLAQKFKTAFDEDQQDEVSKIFKTRVNDIRYINLRTQYSSLLNGMGLEEGFWTPIINEATKYRNSLFHGGSLDIDDDYFQKISYNLRDLVIILIGKYLGLNLVKDRD